MLRFLFGDETRVPSGNLRDAMEAMDQFAAAVHKQIMKGEDPDHSYRKIEIFCRGIRASVDELEESHYAASKFGELIGHDLIHKLTEEEWNHYRRYVYFDKNFFIRVFSVLDKLGRFMNDFYGLNTEKMKFQFSYFTVLRNMRTRQLLPEISPQLDALKERTSDVLNRLRKRRNSEIHYMNPEMEDDLKQSQLNYEAQRVLEDIDKQMSDADEALEMVIESVSIVFSYSLRILYRRQKKSHNR